jgi:DNA polymerase III delta subunit
MRFNEAIRDLQGGGKKYALSGQETYLKEKFLEAIGIIYPDVKKSEFYPGEELEASKALYSSGIFGNRIVVLRYYDQMKGLSLRDLAGNFDGILVGVLSDEYEKKSESVTTLLGVCTPVQCDRMREYGLDYPSWLISAASAQGYQFIDSAEKVLYQRVGPDLFMLSNELKKLTILKSTSKVIEPSDVLKTVPILSVESRYDVLDSLLKGPVQEAWKTISSYLDNDGDLPALIGFLGHYYEKMYRIVLMNKDKVSAEGMGDILKIPAFLIKTKYLPRAASLGRVRLAEILNMICNLEVKSRTFRGNKRLLIDYFIFSVFR